MLAIAPCVLCRLVSAFVVWEPGGGGGPDGRAKVLPGVWAWRGRGGGCRAGAWRRQPWPLLVDALTLPPSIVGV